MSDSVKIGIVGSGRIGKMHGENIVRFIPSAIVQGIADVNLSKENEAWAKNLGIKTVSNDPDALFNDPSINAILICSPNDTHADLIIAAAKARKHIFCEKPIDLNVKKVAAALDAVEKSKVKLQIGFNRRFDHNFKRVKEVSIAGALGDIQMVKITSRDPAPPPISYIPVSGGIFMDMMIHDFDMARFQAGSEIVEVYASGAVLIDPAIGEAGDVDTAMVTLKFENGAIGIIENSRKAVYGYDQRVEVFGSKGAALAENDLPNTVKVLTGEGISTDKPLYFFLERYTNAFVDEIKSFVEAISSDTNTAVTGRDGFANLLAALAAGTSLKENRPVRLKEIYSQSGGN
jgi:myo-inositol 2-dehydrogenase/D-chiro-inositol 1-dehydrogenase